MYTKARTFCGGGEIVGMAAEGVTDVLPDATCLTWLC